VMAPVIDSSKSITGAEFLSESISSPKNARGESKTNIDGNKSRIYNQNHQHKLTVNHRLYLKLAYGENHQETDCS
jgi:hypothetical protein